MDADRGQIAPGAKESRHLALHPEVGELITSMSVSCCPENPE
ncbi:unnamed protein product [Mycena citricolor]|uniref:Uncharacterized protein n=1 Tax=Mycena citricolor TaxID=2018698 RepID=A0AAD2K291_9AGAR|nr:unnamed protein product [Mycena citricolor]